MRLEDAEVTRIKQDRTVCYPMISRASVGIGGRHENLNPDMTWSIGSGCTPLLLIVAPWYLALKNQKQKGSVVENMYEYESLQEVIASIKENVIGPAEAKVKELRQR